ncbi:hypothetical protein MASR1M101_22970 [Gemmatimonas sp.]
MSLARMQASLHAQLDGKTVGYAYTVGNRALVSGSGGWARTSADGTPQPFTAQTRLTVASVSKWITAIATMAVLQQRDVSLDAPIGPYLPPDWEVPPYLRSLTFAELLTHTTGIKDFGSGPQPYDRLHRFFTRAVRADATTRCAGARVTDPPDPVTPSDRARCYSNYNFAILRLLLPRVAGFPEAPNRSARADTLAAQYERLVQERVFQPVGIRGPACQPQGNRYAFAYFHPGDKPGHDWGDVRLRCGDAGWYVSAEEMARVLRSVVSRDGRILVETAAYSSYADLRTRGLISTSAAIFGPTVGPRVIAVLFINSDIIDGPRDRARGILQKAYDEAKLPAPVAGAGENPIAQHVHRFTPLR